jgi:hypothetical protein
MHCAPHGSAPRQGCTSSIERLDARKCVNLPSLGADAGISGCQTLVNHIVGRQSPERRGGDSASSSSFCANIINQIYFNCFHHFTLVQPTSRCSSDTCVTLARHKQQADHTDTVTVPFPSTPTKPAPASCEPFWHWRLYFSWPLSRLLRGRTGGAAPGLDRTWARQLCPCTRLRVSLTTAV